jgi:hypothetical protein
MGGTSRKIQRSRQAVASLHAFPSKQMEPLHRLLQSVRSVRLIDTLNVAKTERIQFFGRAYSCRPQGESCELGPHHSPWLITFVVGMPSILFHYADGFGGKAAGIGPFVARFLSFLFPLFLFILLYSIVTRSCPEMKRKGAWGEKAVVGSAHEQRPADVPPHQPWSSGSTLYGGGGSDLLARREKKLFLVAPLPVTPTP